MSEIVSHCLEYLDIVSLVIEATVPEKAMMDDVMNV